MKKITTILILLITLVSCTKDTETNYCSNDSNLYVSAVLDNEEKVIGEVSGFSVVAGSIFYGGSSSINMNWQGESFDWVFFLILPDIILEEGATYTFDDGLSFTLITGSGYEGLQGSLHIEELEFITTEQGYKEVQRIKATLNGQYQKNGTGVYDINMDICAVITNENE